MVTTPVTNSEGHCQNTTKLRPTDSEKQFLLPWVLIRLQVFLKISDRDLRGLALPGRISA